MFCVQLYGKRAYWGNHNLYFEALKGLLLKNAPIFFFSDFCRKCQQLSRNMIKWSHWDPQNQSIKSTFSMWLYNGVEEIYILYEIWWWKF